MLFDLEVKTKKLERSHFIRNVYAHSDGKVLTLHLTNRDIYKPQLKIEPGCHVYHNGEEFTIQEYSFDGYLNLVLDKNPPSENYSLLNSRCIHVPGHLEGNQLVLFTTQRAHRRFNFNNCFLICNGKTYHGKQISQQPTTHYIVMNVEEVTA